MSYTDVSATAAADILAQNRNAVLLDVRLADELEDVGMPDVSNFLHVEWLTMPVGDINPDFVSEVQRAGVQADDPVLVLCRVGSRSKPAAEALAAAGYRRVYNILEGFEGEANADGYRGTVGGWLFEGLPWREDIRKVA